MHYIYREKYMEKIMKAFEHLPIVVLIGARQVGKTTLMENIPINKSSLFLNGQNPELAEIFQKFSTLEKYLQINLNPQIDGYLLIDEFQFIPNVSTSLKLLADKYGKLKILCSGSSSLDVIQHVEESLTGRMRMLNIYSLSFEEYLKFENEKLYFLYKKYDQETKHEVVDPRIYNAFKEYLIYGGFPRSVQAVMTQDKIELIHDIYQTYLLKDIRNFIRNEDVVSFNKLLKLLAAQIGNLVNINELSKTSGLNYKKCVEYLYVLEQMYIIKLIPPYFTNKKKVITKMRKVYFLDLGLRNIIYNNFNAIDFRVDKGMLFENYVFLDILKSNPDTAQIYYYRTKDGSEVDFLVNNMIEKSTFEVKYKDFSKTVTFKNLLALNQSEEIKKSYLVNMNLNAQHNGYRFIQGYLLSKLQN